VERNPLRTGVKWIAVFLLGYEVGGNPTLYNLFSHSKKEKTKIRDIWNSVGESCLERVKTCQSVAKLTGGDIKNLEVSDMAQIDRGKVALKYGVWDFPKYLVPVFVVGCHTLKIPLRIPGRQQQILLLAEVETDKLKWEAKRVWVETEGQGAVCVPLV